MNGKCSWSYKSQDKTKNNTMETDSDDFSYFEDVQVSKKANGKVLRDISLSANSEGLLHEQGDFAVNRTELQNYVNDKGNSHKMKTYDKANSNLKTKPKSFKSLSQSNSSKTKNISMNENNTTSSSDEEVFQTRYSTLNKNAITKDNYHDDFTTTLSEGASFEEYSFKNNLNVNTTPIVIKAVAFDEKNEYQNNTEQTNKTKQREIENIKENNEEIDSTNISRMETYQSNSDTNRLLGLFLHKDSKIFHAEDNLKKKKTSLDQLMRNLTNVSEQKYTHTNVLEESKLTSDDDIIQDFLDGVLDVSIYQSEKKTTAEKLNKSKSSTNEQFGDKAHAFAKQRNIKYTSGKKETYKRKAKEPATSRKKTKESNSNYDEMELLISPKSALKGLKKKTPSAKKEKKVYNTKKRNEVESDFEEYELKSKVKLSNIKEKKSTYKNLARDQHKTPKYEMDPVHEIRSKTVVEAINDGSLTKKYSTRKVRNSSLIAAEKIKQIEKIENQSKDSEDASDSKNDQELYLEQNRVDDVYSVKQSKESKDSFKNKFTSLKVSEHNPSEKNRHKNRNSCTSFTNYFLSENEDLQNSTQSIFTNTNLQKNRDSPEVHKASYLTPAKSATGSLVNSEKRHRTWEILEKELLEEFGDKPLLNSDTVILKQEEIFSKKKIVKDKNLLTVSNTSLKKTISKSKEGNKYNMQYEIKNTESKYVQTKDDSTYSFLDSFRRAQANEAKSASSKALSIVEKTIAAMEKCTTNFLETRVNYNTEQQKNFHCEDIYYNSSDANQEAQFHTSITLMANDNEQYYSNKIVGYMKKSKENDKKTFNFQQNKNVSKKQSDSSSELRKSIDENLGDIKHSKQSVKGSSMNKMKNYAQKLSSDEKCLDMVPYSEEKHCGIELIKPHKIDKAWDKLLKSCIENCEDRTYPDDNFKFNKVENLKTSPMIKNDSKGNDKIITPIYSKIEERELEEQITLSENEENKLVEDDEKQIGETQSIMHHKSMSENSISLNRQKLNSKIPKFCSPKMTDRKERYFSHDQNAKHENTMKLVDIEDKVVEKQVVKEFNETSSVKTCPIYKLKIDRDGSVKFKMHSSRSSSTNSLISLPDLKQIASKNFKTNKCHKYTTNKTRDKYKKYLKKLFGAQDSTQMGDKTDDQTKENVLQEVDTEDNPNNIAEKTTNPKTILQKKLIAENEDDLFSLSSSDSERGTTASPGTGLLCELFF